MRLFPWQKQSPAPLTQAEIDKIVDERVERSLASFNVEPGKPERPYSIDNPWLYYVTTMPSKLPGKDWSTRQLRQWAKYYDPLRSIIEYLKAEAASTPIHFVPKPGYEDQDCEAAMKAINDFIGDQGALGGKFTRRVFEARMFEDLLVVGAYAVWYQFDRRRRVLGCYNIDAATVKPIVDAFGWPSETVPYEQWIIGVKTCDFKPGEIRMDGMLPNTETPYFQSTVELAVGRVLSGISVDDWNTTWLTKGTSGTNDVWALPESFTIEQTREWMEVWELMNSDIAGRQRTKWVPAGSQKIGDHSRKDQEFQDFEVQTIRRLCALFGVQPASIGYTGEQYKVTQGDSMDASRRVGLGRMLAVRKEFYDDLCVRLGYPMLEMKDVEDETDRMATMAEIGVKSCGGAFKTINEVRADNGLPPVEGGDVIPGTVKEPEPVEEVPDAEPEDENEGVSEA